ncbi:MAG: hypothetical protein KatS3mg023_3782 [Armatimonadota bacterium]|nr:MAG: hypothetical protein KatS3mg023_3782 [Armatimonadota bacterium]
MLDNIYLEGTVVSPERGIYLLHLTFEDIALLLDEDLGYIRLEEEGDLVVQRDLNKGRVKDIQAYITQNDDWFLPPILLSLVTEDADSALHIPQSEFGKQFPMFKLVLGEGSYLRIIDGQHRVAAVSGLVSSAPDKYGGLPLPAVMVVSRGIDSDRQLFADVNGKAVRVNPSAIVEFDSRDDKSKLARQILYESRYLPYVTSRGNKKLRRKYNQELINAGGRPVKLVSLNGIHRILEITDDTQNHKVYVDLFDQVLIPSLPKLLEVVVGRESPKKLSADYIHTHDTSIIAISTFAIVDIKANYPDNWKQIASEFFSIVDWRKSNPVWAPVLTRRRGTNGERKDISSGNTSMIYNIVDILRGMFTEYARNKGLPEPNYRRLRYSKSAQNQLALDAT